MQNENQTSNATSNNDENTATPQNTDTAVADEQNTASNEADTLNAIQPSTGENNTTEPSNIHLNRNSFQAEIETTSSAAPIDNRGVLDETELEYSSNAVSFTPLQLFIPQTETNQTQALPNTAPAPLAQTTPTLPKATIKVSNATDNQKHINDTDHYNIDAENINKTHKLYGAEMDIQGVSDNTQVNYVFKTGNRFNATLKSDWNTLKNIDITSEDLDTVMVKNFVHADVSLQGDANKTINIIDAKRGVIETENGDDVITVKALTNGAGWSNTFKIDSGAGNDKITVKGHAGHTIADINAGNGNDTVTIKGQYDHSNTDLGAGNDRFNGGTEKDTIHGGTGNDRINAKAGHDVLYGDDTMLAEASLTTTKIDFEFIKSQAGYKNTVGFYTVADNGNIENVQIVFENLKALNAGDTQSYDIAPNQNGVEAFIIANGYNKNNQYSDLDLNNADLDFIYNHGQNNARPAQITDDADAVSLVYNDGAQEIVLKGHVFHDIQTLNQDGHDHTIETTNTDTTEFNFEDLFNLGDRDYSDAVFNVKEIPLYDFSYNAIDGGNDVLRGDAGNDLIIGGAGNDYILGGADTDIAVFMGSTDEYHITKSGSKYIIEDTVEGRDGTDTIKGVEGLIFGIEDLYADILNHGNANQTNALDLSDLIEGYAPLQNAIDNFINNADQGHIESIAIQNNVPELMIFTPQDALLQTQDIIA